MARHQGLGAAEPAAHGLLGLEGPVLLQAVITENGTVQDLKVVRGQPILARAAVDAVRQWRYRPYRLNGKPVRMQTEITIDFKLP